MIKRIPESRTWSVNNKCIWALFSRSRNIDNNNFEVTRDWNDTSLRLTSTEPQPVGTRDTILIQQSAGLGESVGVTKVWIKDLIIDFSSFDYSIENIARTFKNTELPLITGKWNILDTSQVLGLEREQWLFITKQN